MTSETSRVQYEKPLLYSCRASQENEPRRFFKEMKTRHVTPKKEKHIVKTNTAPLKSNRLVLPKRAIPQELSESIEHWQRFRLQSEVVAKEEESRGRPTTSVEGGKRAPAGRPGTFRK